MKKAMKFFILLLIYVACSFTFISCQNKDKDDIENLNGSQYNTSSNGNRTSSDSLVESSSSFEEDSGKMFDYDVYTPPKIGIKYIPEKFKIENYMDELSDRRVSISKVRLSYDEDSSHIIKNGINKMNFEKCIFKEIPAFIDVCSYYNYWNHISQEKSWGLIEYWAKQMDGIENVDLDKEVVNTSRFARKDEIDAGKTGIADHPLAKNDYDEKTGKWKENGESAFFFLNNDIGYVDVNESGVQILSFGRVADYYCKHKGGVANRTIDPYNLMGAELVKKGDYEELKNDKYELLDGEMSVVDAAKKIDDFLKFSDENLGYDVYQVEIYKIIDKYTYRFLLRRKYRDIPLPWTTTGQITYYGDISKYWPDGDIAHAVVCDHNGIDAYYGFSGNEEFEEIIPRQNEIIDLAEAANRIKEAISPEYCCEIKQVEFTYLNYAIHPDIGNGKVLVPAWEFIGENLIDDNNIKIYVDALTGDVCFYEYLKDV